MAGEAVGQTTQLHELQQLVDDRLYCGLGQASAARAHAQPERDVFEDCHVAEQRIVLEHEPDLAITRVRVRRIIAVEGDRSRVRCLEPGNHPQQRRLAGAGWAEQCQQLAGGDCQIDIVDRDKFTETLGNAGELDAHANSSPMPGADARVRRSTISLSTSVSNANNASSDATAKAAANWYSL